jgi:putative intracellular protease/amidase
MLRFARLVCQGCLWVAVLPLFAAGEDVSPGGVRGAASSRAVKVAVFHDSGVSGKVSVLLDLLKKQPDLEAAEVNGGQIRAGALKGFDVALFPGGSGSGEAKALEEAGRDQVRSFVEQGGGFLGICAGAYLASADYDWSLHLLDAKVLDRKHWARGSGNVEVSLTESGMKLLGAEGDRATILYWQGPLLAPAGKAEIPDYEVLGTFATEIAKNGAPSGVMVGTTAIARGSYGKGRVFCFSPHPERSEGVQSFVRRAILWTAGRE